LAAAFVVSSVSGQRPAASGGAKLRLWLGLGLVGKTFFYYYSIIHIIVINTKKHKDILEEEGVTKKKNVNKYPRTVGVEMI
jgi:hypothetical protein